MSVTTLLKCSSKKRFFFVLFTYTFKSITLEVIEMMARVAFPEEDRCRNV